MDPEQNGEGDQGEDDDDGGRDDTCEASERRRRPCRAQPWVRPFHGAPPVLSLLEKAGWHGNSVPSACTDSV